MKPVLTSHTQSVEEMEQALESAGVTVVTEAETGSEETAETSEQPEKPGETPAAPPASESAPASEAGEKKPQQAPPADGDGQKPRANFKGRVEKLERSIERLGTQLEDERSDKARIEAQLRAAEEELRKLRPEPAKDAKPQKPKRPMRGDPAINFDEEKFDEALARYEDEIADFYSAESKRVAAEEVAKIHADQVREQSVRQFEERRNADVAKFEDWEDLLAGMEEDVPLPSVVEAAIQESDRPAILIHYFMDDVVNNGGAEAAKLEGLTPIQQVRRLALIEARIAAEIDKPKAETAPPAVESKPASPAEPPPPQEKAPVPPKPKAQPRVPEEPIEPVGTRTTGQARTLGDARSFKEFLKLTEQGVRR